MPLVYASTRCFLSAAIHLANTVRSAPEILLKRKSPPHEQSLAPRIFHLNLQFPAPRVLDLKLKHHTTEQATAPRIFHLNRHTTEQATAPRTFRSNRRDLAPRIFHLSLHIICRPFEGIKLVRIAQTDGIDAASVPEQSLPSQHQPRLLLFLSRIAPCPSITCRHSEMARYEHICRLSLHHGLQAESRPCAPAAHQVMELLQHSARIPDGER
jgi:hypothetical protein